MRRAGSAAGGGVWLGVTRRSARAAGSVTTNSLPVPGPSLCAVDLAAVHLDQAARQCQPDAEPALRAATRAIDLREHVED